MFILNKHWALFLMVRPAILDNETGLEDQATMLHFAACSITRTGCAEEGSAQAQQTAGRVEENLDDQPMHNDPW